MLSEFSRFSSPLLSSPLADDISLFVSVVSFCAVLLSPLLLEVEDSDFTLLEVCSAFALSAGVSSEPTKVTNLRVNNNSKVIYA